MISDKRISMITMDAEDEAEINDGQFTMDLDDYRALITRLEAAENCIAHSHGPASSFCCVKEKELDQAWRKAAGK